MKDFSTLYEQAASRKGGKQALEKLIPKVEGPGIHRHPILKRYN